MNFTTSFQKGLAVFFNFTKVFEVSDFGGDTLDTSSNLIFIDRSTSEKKK